MASAAVEALEEQAAGPAKDVPANKRQRLEQSDAVPAAANAQSSALGAAEQAPLQQGGRRPITQQDEEHQQRASRRASGDAEVCSLPPLHCSGLACLSCSRGSTLRPLAWLCLPYFASTHWRHLLLLATGKRWRRWAACSSACAATCACHLQHRPYLQRAGEAEEPQGCRPGGGRGAEVLGWLVSGCLVALLAAVVGWLAPRTMLICTMPPACLGGRIALSLISTPTDGLQGGEGLVQRGLYFPPGLPVPYPLPLQVGRCSDVGSALGGRQELKFLLFLWAC